MPPGDSPSKQSALAEPLAEGIHKDTDGPDKVSDSGQDFAHLPGRYLVLADSDVPTSRLGHGPHLLPSSFLPGKDNGCSGRRCRMEASPIMPTGTDTLAGIVVSCRR